MNYDNWKQQTPEENEYEQQCVYCGNPTDESYCSNECKHADLL